VRSENGDDARKTQSIVYRTRAERNCEFRVIDHEGFQHAYLGSPL
jgi:hypothetical protein